MDELLLPGSSPIISFRILFKAGSVLDPKGREGLAALTAAMVSAAGSRTETYEQIVKAMYPMATAFSSQVDKEMSVFFGQTHTDNLDAYYRTISNMLLDPGWRGDDFARVREDQINFLKVNLRASNEEELAKEQLYNFIYRDSRYGHTTEGTITAIERMTLEDVKWFHQQFYNQSNLLLGISGGYPEGFVEKVEADFRARLPIGKTGAPPIPEPEKINGLGMQIVEKETRGIAISLGFPIEVTRSHPDYPALLVAQSHFGQHRSSNSLLFQQIRQIRGMNYGDYAYIEYFPRGMFKFHPDPNLGRSKQI
ncbi:MAG TPA: insulinase family protein, partial [Blastocatellia bacterium]|nr:insulinase family protein [Blastocatellia bacterium]